MNKVKGIRFPLIAVAFALATISVQFIQSPIHAAQQNSTTSAETVTQSSGHALEDPGAKSYAKNCAICHGDEREGILPAFPPLMGISHQMSDDKISAIIHVGKGRMPGFPNLQNGELSALVHYLGSASAASKSGDAGAKVGEPTGIAAAGGELFHQNCAFCHGRDAMGGESGPDLTQSKLVLTDTTGEKIAAVVREGRPDNKMPGFNFSSQELRSIIAFIHDREVTAAAHPGGRRGVAVEDLQPAMRKPANNTLTALEAASNATHLAGILRGLRIATRVCNWNSACSIHETLRAL